jgi:hypothetical protein
MNRRAAQTTPLVVLTRTSGGELRVTRYEKRKCTHLGWVEPELAALAVDAMQHAPPDDMRRGYLDVEEAAWDNYGRDPDHKLGVIHQLIGTPEA